MMSYRITLTVFFNANLEQYLQLGLVGRLVLQIQENQWGPESRTLYKILYN